MTGAATTEVLLTETAGRVRILTLNRPTVRNALSSELRECLFSALRAANCDDDVDVVILTGTDPAFCAGLDLRELASGIPDLSPQWPDMTKPVIGAINGVAVTGGLELALYCDVLIASERARFADTHARVGLLPMWGMSVRLPLAVGRGLARRLSLSGEYLTAEQAAAAGLVTEVVPHHRLLDTAMALAESIAAGNQNAVRALVSSYRSIDAAAEAHGLAVEACTATAWLYNHQVSETVAANRESVIERGREQVHGAPIERR
ncbi:enoyl-CoA hydratase [Mycolicibacterium sp. CBM1]